MMANCESFYTPIIDAESGRCIEDEMVSFITADMDRLANLNRKQIQIIILGTNDLRKKNVKAGQIIHYFRQILQKASFLKDCLVVLSGLIPSPKTDYYTKAEQ